jgi:molybdenum cofactor biosynthesis protein MoaC
METPGTSPRPADETFRMIDVGGKPATLRRAVAEGLIHMAEVTVHRILAREMPKGDVLAQAEIAGILAAKRTSEILPLCHPLPLDAVRVRCEAAEGAIRVTCEAAATARTGVEMEALTGVTAALLAIYDLTKGVDPALTIGEIRLRLKEGGKSGRWVHPFLGGAGHVHPGHGGAATSAAQPALGGVRFGVLTVSDRCSRGEAVDGSGPAITEILAGQGARLSASRLVPDDVGRIGAALRELVEEVGRGLVVATGGTGLGPRDVTPEAARTLWSRTVPGLAERLRQEGARRAPMAWLSRCEAGVISRSLVILLPGSVKAVREGLETLLPLLPHALEMMDGGGHAP